MINMNIDLGNIITLISMLVLLITFGANVKSSVMTLQQQVAEIKVRLDDQNKILIELARYDGRLALLEHRLDFALNVRPVHVTKLTPAGER